MTRHCTKGITTDLDYGIQQIILHGNIDGYVTTSWGKDIFDSVALWETQIISGKGHGIVATINVCKGTCTCIAMYGGDITDSTNKSESGGSHALS